MKKTTIDSDKTCDFCYKEKGILFVYPRLVKVEEINYSNYGYIICFDCFSMHCDEWKAIQRKRSC